MTLTQEQFENLHIKNLTPREIVSELDRYVIGQDEAKRAVSIALRNRWRRLNVKEDIREDITPKNIIMIGPTGVGKTEIARRLAKLANSPFLKVEATKFTEVGYVGKDVESMVRDLLETSISMVREAERERVQVKANELAEERLLDLLLPPKPKKSAPQPAQAQEFTPDLAFEGPDKTEEPSPTEQSSRAKMREFLRSGKLNDRKVELDINPKQPHFGGGLPMIEVISAGGSMEDISNNIRDMIGNFMPAGRKHKKVPVPEAIKLLAEEEAARLIDMDNVTKMAIDLAENNGIIFIDEIDKIASSGSAQGRGEVSREGVQRDILPIIEGSTVSTKYGFVKTDHVLFIAAGAFHMTKPSDLIPELQGRFPIRVELKPLTKKDFLRILIEPQSSLTKQYMALLKTEGVDLEFTQDSLEELSRIAAEANDQMENIGARRLHTILEKVMDEISFTASEKSGQKFLVDGAYVKKCLTDIIKDQDLRRFIL